LQGYYKQKEEGNAQSAEALRYLGYAGCMHGIGRVQCPGRNAESYPNFTYQVINRDSFWDFLS